MSDTKLATDAAVVELCYGIHVGLRKGSHTLWSSMLWNLINAAEGGAWGVFCDHVHRHMEAGVPLADALRKPADLTSEPHINLDIERGSMYRAIAFAFQLCDAG